MDSEILSASFLARADIRAAEAHSLSRCVYFVLAPSLRAVKIGYTGSLFSRIDSIQMGCPEELGYVRLIPGLSASNFRAAEQWFHKRYAPLRIRREWFRACDDMLHAQLPSRILASRSYLRLVA